MNGGVQNRGGRAVGEAVLIRPHEKILCDVAEAATLWSISERSMRDLIHQGVVPSVRFGKRVLIPVEGLRAAWNRLKESG
jgi:excisionase family DNA binding protein